MNYDNIITHGGGGGGGGVWESSSFFFPIFPPMSHPVVGRGSRT